MGPRLAFVSGGWRADDVKYSRPTLFRWAELSTGAVVGCRVFTNRQPASGWHTFRLSDANQNSYWGPYFNGVELEPNGVLLDFTAGTSYVNMERGNANDPGTAEWTALGVYRNGGFVPWAGHQRLAGNFGPGSYNMPAVDHGKAVP